LVVGQHSHLLLKHLNLKQKVQRGGHSTGPSLQKTCTFQTQLSVDLLHQVSHKSGNKHRQTGAEVCLCTQIKYVLYCADINRTQDRKIFGGNILYRILCISDKEYRQYGQNLIYALT
jgi:hypothetical protein